MSFKPGVDGALADRLIELIEELLDAHCDTVCLLEETLDADRDTEGHAHVEYLKDLQRLGQRALAELGSGASALDSRSVRQLRRQ